MNGRKRRILTDVLGLITAAAVHGADIQDRDGAEPLPARVCGRIARLKLIPADGIYNGDIAERVKKHFGAVPEAVQRPEGSKGFTLLPRRWAVERTFAWLNRHRRLGNIENLPPQTVNIFMGRSSDATGEKCDFCKSARPAAEGFIAAAENLRGFGRSLYRGLKGHRIWSLLCQTAYNLKKFLQLYFADKIKEESLTKLGIA